MINPEIRDSHEPLISEIMQYHFGLVVILITHTQTRTETRLTLNDDAIQLQASSAISPRVV